MPWRDCLGADSGQACGKCDGPLYWTGAHTALTCPEHDTPIWSTSPGVRERSTAYAAALDKRANRTAATIADPAAERARRAEADRASIALAQRKAIMLRQLDALAHDDRLHPDSLPAIQWFDDEVRDADTDERLDELTDLLPAYIRRRHWWQRSLDADLDEGLTAWDGDEDQDDDEDLLPSAFRPPAPAPALCPCGAEVSARRAWGANVYCLNCGALITSASLPAPQRQTPASSTEAMIAKLRRWA